MRSAIRRACALGGGLTTKDWRALGAVVFRTASYSRLEDGVTHSVLTEIAGLHPKDLSKSLRKLALLGVINYRPGSGKRFSRVSIAPGGEATSPRDGSCGEIGFSQAGSPPSREATWPPSTEGESASPNEKDYEEDPREGHCTAPSLRTTHAVTREDRKALRQLVEVLDDADQRTYATYGEFLGRLHAGHFAYLVDKLDEWRDGVGRDGHPITSEAAFVYHALRDFANGYSHLPVEYRRADDELESDPPAAVSPARPAPSTNEART
jgi:hypothetical protein